MEIVIELTLCINLFLNSFILKLTSLFLREKIRLWVVSALFGAIVSIISPLAFLSPFYKILLEFCVVFIMVLISFKYTSFKRFMLTSSVLLLVTFIFGGGCLAVQNAVGTFPVFVVVIISTVIYVIAKIILKLQQRLNIIKNFTYKIIIKDKGREICEEGFLDSGNMLYDTITKKPVILINFDVFHRLFENISYISAMSKTFDESSIKNGHYIKINSIGSGTSIFVFTVDEISVGDERSFKNAMIGLSFSGFEKTFGKKILLHSELV